MFPKNKVLVFKSPGLSLIQGVGFVSQDFFLHNQTIIRIARCLPSGACKAAVNRANEVNSLSLKMFEHATLLSAGNVLPATTSDNQDELISSVSCNEVWEFDNDALNKKAHPDFGPNVLKTVVFDLLTK